MSDTRPGLRRVNHRARDMSGALKAWRAVRELGEEQAAAHLGVTPDLLRAWERGQPVPFPALVETAMGLPVARKVMQ